MESLPDLRRLKQGCCVKWRWEHFAGAHAQFQQLREVPPPVPQSLDSSQV